jgi:hypothetical protein
MTSPATSSNALRTSRNKPSTAWAPRPVVGMRGVGVPWVTAGVEAGVWSVVPEVGVVISIGIAGVPVARA